MARTASPNFLKLAQVKVAKLHSSRSQDQRLQALQDFKDGKVQVLVATDIVARGIDIDGVTHVVNYDFPVNPEDYVHRIGRTGRAEAQGDAISFVPKEDLNLLGILELFIGRRLDAQAVARLRLPRPHPRLPRPVKNRRAATGANAPAKWRRKRPPSPPPARRKNLLASTTKNRPARRHPRINNPPPGC